jgi:hypothetical protein
MTALLRQKDEIWIKSGRTRSNGRVLLGTGVHARFELPAKLALQEADDPVMLELFADRSDENRTHRAPPKY